jgi:hypothetical protein
MERLRKTAEWLSRLRRIVELFNRVLDGVSKDYMNEARISIVEAFGKIENH